MPYRMFLAATCIAMLAGCEKAPEYDPAHDYFSFARPHEFVTDHLVLDLDVDFDTRQLRGTATLHMRNLHPHARVIALDSRDLDVRGAKVGLPGEDKVEAAFRITDTHPQLGQRLNVELPTGFDPQGGFELEIDYATSPGASAMQWLPPELTSGGQQPMVFSQSQAIHARSWVPLQDTPAMRMTYEATIRTPSALLALMSADNDPATERDGEYHFQMPQPIPPYLLAIAVGDFHFAPIGEDTGVYSEPELLEASAWEFAETQDMLDLAERRFGPYDWGRYDLLILPPSFPYGGMENPRLSFITPSVLAGDRSLVSLIAHELAHSWSGNLVTNATLRDSWLNEGTTSYLEARLMEDLFGKERADEERVLVWESLQRGLQTVPAELQALAPKFLPDRHEDAQDGIQYAKGQFFLEHLERLFGREVFDEFIMGWFSEHAWQSVTSEQFLDYLDKELLQASPGPYGREQAAEWLYQPGVPSDFQPPRSARLEAAAASARAWAAGEQALVDIASDGWSPQTYVQFINSLPPALESAQLAELDAHFGFSTSANVLVTRAWFTQVAVRRFEPAYAAMREHLLRHGRMYLVTPVYRALAANGADSELAREIFAAARDSYHPITVSDVERALAQAGESH